MDTNVLYAGLRSQNGASHGILEAIWMGRVTILLSQTVLTEYEEILKQYVSQLNLNFADIDVILNALCGLCQRHELSGPWTPVLQDPDDEAFVKLAVAGRADYLITYNLRHFAPAAALRINLLAPGEFLVTI